MAKISKAKLKEALAEWESLALQTREIEARRDAELAPMRERFAKKCQPIEAAATEELLPLQSRMTELSALIQDGLLSGCEPDGSVSLREVDTEGAKALVESSSQRNIEPSELFNFVPAAQRDGKFWELLKVQIGKAEKYLGSKIDQLATPKITHRVKVFLKD